MVINSCSECLKKQREIDKLTDEATRLKKKLRYEERRAKDINQDPFPLLFDETAHSAPEADADRSGVSA